MLSIRCVYIFSVSRVTLKEIWLSATSTSVQLLVSVSRDWSLFNYFTALFVMHSINNVKALHTLGFLGSAKH